MQHLPQGVKDKEGCFVYQFIGGSSIAVRSTRNVGDDYKTDRSFDKGDLISIDLVCPSRTSGSSNGPFLRLSDGSGWLFQNKYNEKMMKRIDVMVGLWCFFVDNCPCGITLRKHPNDSNGFGYENVTYKPMQKIYCDRKVQHPSTGINFYRVQGTDGWVFDRRLSEEYDDNYMLLKEDMVKSGLFVYECISSNDISIRKSPAAVDHNRTDLDVLKGQLVAVDIVRKCRSSNSDGPFLRLTDGSGWLFEKKNNQQLMKPILIQEGKWRCKIKNSPAGLGLRRQPIDSQRMREGSVSYKPGEIVHCSHMVQASSGVKFYRVKGTEGWIFDKRNDEVMLTVLSGKSQSKGSIDFSDGKSDSSGWSPEFVRGVAAAFEGVAELSMNERSRVISFGAESGNVRINVYYTTQTIGTALSHPDQGATQLFRRDCTTDELIKIFENPRIHTGKGYKQRRKGKNQHKSKNGNKSDQLISTSYGNGLMAGQEIELRKALLEADEDVKTMNEKKQRLLTRIRDIDLERAKEAEKMKANYDKRWNEYFERQRKDASDTFSTGSNGNEYDEYRNEGASDTYSTGSNGYEYDEYRNEDVSDTFSTGTNSYE